MRSLSCLPTQTHSTLNMAVDLLLPPTGRGLYQVHILFANKQAIEMIKSLPLFMSGVPGLMSMEVISIVKPTRCTNVSNLFYFGMTHYMLRTVFPSIIRSSRLCIQMSNRYCCICLCSEIFVHFLDVIYLKRALIS